MSFMYIDVANNQLIFSSDTKTKHTKDFTLNPKVAGSIALETKEVAKRQGVQLLGEIIELKGEDLKAAKKTILTSIYLR